MLPSGARLGRADDERANERRCLRDLVAIERSDREARLANRVTRRPALPARTAESTEVPWPSRSPPARFHV